MEKKCIFKDPLQHLCKPESKLFNKTLSQSETKINKVISCSIERKDDFHKTVKDNPGSYHENCYVTYTSKVHIQRYLKKRKEQTACPEQTPVKRTRHSIGSSDFNLKEDCLFCAKKVQVVPDSKHPDRWEESYIARTADRGKGKASVKEVLLKKCDEHNDEFADQVRVRLNSKAGDLHAMDARYHLRCYQKFTSVRNIRYSKKTLSETAGEEDAIDSVIQILKESPTKSFNSVELYHEYKKNGGKKIPRVFCFMEKISSRIEKTHYQFKIPGCASLIVPKEVAAKYYKVEPLDEEPLEASIKLVAKQIKKEINQFNTLPDSYTNISTQSCSSTLLSLLKKIDNKLENHLSSYLIGNMIATVIKGGFTMLQIALALEIDSKKLIETLHTFGVTSTYQELRRFKISSASHSDSSGQKEAKHLVQVISDNFDCDISTPNGIKQTHALATILCTKDEQTLQKIEIPRLKHSVLPSVPLKHIEKQVYIGDKKNSMPLNLLGKEVSSLATLCLNAVSILEGRESCEKNFKFISDTLENSSTPDFHGYNHREIRLDCAHKGTDLPIYSRVTIQYLPLVDNPPTDPSTILTAMVEAEKQTKERGQMYTVFTADQQLFAIVLNIVWSDPNRWKMFIPRLGGMHLLMSFIGCIGTLMGGSGLKEILKSAFGGVERMLLGKKYPSNVRALRMVLIELLRYSLPSLKSYSELECWLNQMSMRSSLARHWVQNFIKPVLIILSYIRAEREGNFALHLYTCKQMLPYFFAANHYNYARYSVYYLKIINNLPQPLLKCFLDGEHTVRQIDGIWNGIWTDMLIETQYMKYGKGPKGIIGITTNQEALHVWAKSHHAATTLIKDLDEIRDSTDPVSTRHKEEGEKRIINDEKDRLKLRKALETCVHPLLELESPVCNIYTGEIASEQVNVQNSLHIGEIMLTEFDDSLPDSFYKKMSKKVVTIGQKNNSATKTKDPIKLNTDIILTRVLYLLNRDVELENIFQYELSPMPTSLFKTNIEANYPKNKSILLNILKVDQSSRVQKPSCYVIDGGALIYNVHWPTGDCVQTFAKGIFSSIMRKLELGDVYLVFDKYRDFSIKSDTRKARVSSLKKSYIVTETMPLPLRDALLNSNESKSQLIDVICRYILEHSKTFSNNLYITWESAKVISCGKIFDCKEIQSQQEEADAIIPLLVNHAIHRGFTDIQVHAEDTDVFCLLLHFYNFEKWKVNLAMVSKYWSISIAKSAIKHVDLLDKDILNFHALTGCDTVPMMHGIGKKASLQSYKKQPVPNLHLSDEEASIQESKLFVAACYSSKDVKCGEESSKNRELLWNLRAKKGGKPSLKALPPTDKALLLNILRARYQSILWHNALNHDFNPPDPCLYGWAKDITTKSLYPVMLPPDTLIAPEEVMSSINCACKSNNCNTKSCGCNKIGVKCSEFCLCIDCQNHDSQTLDDNDDDFIESNDESDEE